MKFLRKIAVFCALSMLLLLCGACGKNSADIQEDGTAETLPAVELSSAIDHEEQEPRGEGAGCTEWMGQTAVVLANQVLTDGYSYIYSDPSDYSTYERVVPLDSYMEVSAGDIVLILTEEDGMSKVVIPYGDYPWIYGSISSSLLSTDPAYIERGNQAIVEDCESYDLIDGSLIDTINGKVRIIWRNGEWTYVLPHIGGEGPCWIHTSELTFHFDDVVPD